MKRKYHTAEQIVSKLRQADAVIASGGTLEAGLQAIRHQRCDVLQLAKAIRPDEARPGQAAQVVAERERSAQEAGGGFVAG